MTLFRSAVVSEYQSAKVSTTRVRWQAFRVVRRCACACTRRPPPLTLTAPTSLPRVQLTWAVTGATGAFLVMGQNYKGNSRGEHALQGVQAAVRGAWEGVVTGEWGAAAAAAAPAAHTPPPAGAPAGEGRGPELK